MMTLAANQSVPRSSASEFTTVGFSRVSIGPPIKVMLCGTSGSPSASMSDTAAITGTEGWHTAMTWTSPENRRNISIR